MRRLHFFLLLASLLVAVPAPAHLVLDRRPLDVLVARAESMFVAEAARGTRVSGNLRVTEFRVVTCLAGPCPSGVFGAAGLDDHAAEFAVGKRYLVGLVTDPVKLPGGASVRYRVVQNAWEAGEFDPARLDELRRFVPRFAAMLKLPPAERETAYLAALLEQVAANDPALREDALRSLLLFPEGRVTEAAQERILDRLYVEPRENVRVGLLALANTWSPVKARRRLAKSRDGFGDASLAKALFVLGAGDAEAALPCDYLTAPSRAVRAAAVGACTPPGGDWMAVAAAAIDDADAAVRTAARDRLRRAGKGAVSTWALAREPWWRRAYFHATGKAPRLVTDLFPSR